MTVIPSSPVRGRDEHLAALDRALDLARAGRGSVTVLEGGPGMGKTRLLQAVWAAELSFRMGRGMGEPGEPAVEHPIDWWLALGWHDIGDNIVVRLCDQP